MADATSVRTLPDVGTSVIAAGLLTNYFGAGDGPPIVLLHGSGPGVTAWQNWHGIMPRLARRHRVLAPDIVGFGFTERPAPETGGVKLWVSHVLGFLDALGIERAILIGNSFGGGVALALTARHAARVAGLVLMGTPAGEFQQTRGLASSYDFEPTLENMAQMLRQFPYDPALVTDEMVAARFAVAQANSGVDTIRRLQPKPGTADAPATVRGVPLEQLDGIETPALILHGREDPIIPLEVAVRMHQHLRNSDLRVFGRCGHWVQHEREDAFVEHVLAFAAANAG
jgi:pimeloyl-ACP methyl ester carboxylesterase